MRERRSGTPQSHSAFEELSTKVILLSLYIIHFLDLNRQPLKRATGSLCLWDLQALCGGFGLFCSLDNAALMISALKPLYISKGFYAHTHKYSNGGGIAVTSITDGIVVCFANICPVHANICFPDVCPVLILDKVDGDGCVVQSVNEFLAVQNSSIGDLATH